MESFKSKLSSLSAAAEAAEQVFGLTTSSDARSDRAEALDASAPLTTTDVRTAKTRSTSDRARPAGCGACPRLVQPPRTGPHLRTKKRIEKTPCITLQISRGRYFECPSGATAPPGFLT